MGPRGNYSLNSRSIWYTSYFGQSYWPIPAQTNFHCATTLSCHYIQYSASEPCSCPGCCIYTYMAPNIPTILPYSTFLNPHSCGFGRGWSHWPTIPFPFGWYTSQTSLIIILYPARDPATFCCFSRLRSYFRPTASSSWRGNALGFPKPQIMGSPWPP